MIARTETIASLREALDLLRAEFATLELEAKRLAKSNRRLQYKIWRVRRGRDYWKAKAIKGGAWPRKRSEAT